MRLQSVELNHNPVRHVSIIYLWNPYLNCANTFGHFKEKLVKVYLALTGNICVCAAPLRGLFCGFEMCGHSSPVFTQVQLTAQELKDLGAVLFVLVCRVGRTNRGHRHDRTRRAGARYEHGQPRLHHHVHPLKQETERKRGGGKPIRSAILTT